MTQTYRKGHFAQCNRESWQQRRRSASLGVSWGRCPTSKPSYPSSPASLAWTDGVLHPPVPLSLKGVLHPPVLLSLKGLRDSEFSDSRLSLPPHLVPQHVARSRRSVQSQGRSEETETSKGCKRHQQRKTGTLGSPETAGPGPRPRGTGALPMVLQKASSACKHELSRGNLRIPRKPKARREHESHEEAGEGKDG